MVASLLVVKPAINVCMWATVTVFERLERQLFFANLATNTKTIDPDGLDIHLKYMILIGYSKTRM